MADVKISSSSGEIPAWFAKPDKNGPWAGVVVLHDAAGMSRDLKNQTGWLASEGICRPHPICSIPEGRWPASFPSCAMRLLVKGNSSPTSKPPEYS